MANRSDAAAARLLALHVRLVGGDRAALDLMWDELWCPLCRRLRRQFLRAPADLIADAATDAIRAYAERPKAFDPAHHAPLDAFVYGIARRMLRDQLRADGRRSKRAAVAAHVLEAHGHCSSERVLTRVLIREIRSALPLVCTPTELAGLMSWLDDADAALVGASGQPAASSEADQRLGRQRLVARTVKRLQRLFRTYVPGGGANAQAAVAKSEWLTFQTALRRLIHHRGDAGLTRTAATVSM